MNRDPDGSVTLRHGDPLKLTCTIELNAAVDIAVIVSGTLSGPGIQIPSSVEYVHSREYQIKETITSLEAARSSVYACSVTVSPGQGVMNVRASERNHITLTVTVGKCKL